MRALCRVALAATVLAAPAGAAAAVTERASVGPGGVEANGSSLGPALSATGRFLAFGSGASNLARGGKPGQVWIRDRRTGRNSIVSRSSRGRPGTAPSYAPSMSPDGRFVAFCSFAPNFAPGDEVELTSDVERMDRWLDVFLRDRVRGTTKRASIGLGGRQPNERSCDRDEFGTPAVSANGRYVAFISEASNLVRADTNGRLDAFVRDMATGTTRRVSVSSGGRQANDDTEGVSISANGRFVGFCSSASNLVRRDRNPGADLFVHDLVTRKTTLAGLTAEGEQRAGHCFSTPSLSADGRFVAFSSYAQLVRPVDGTWANVYVKDRRTGGITLMTGGVDGRGANHHVYDPMVSANGRWVVWWSQATNLVANDASGSTDDVFLGDRLTGRVQLVSVRSDGAQVSTGFKGGPAISGDGRFVAWHSDSPDFVPSDTNGEYDVFVRGALR